MKSLENYGKFDIKKFKSNNLKCKYNNFGYVMLGDIISNISNLTYQQYINEYLFKPLNITNIDFNYNKLNDNNDNNDNIVTGYIHKYGINVPLLRWYYHYYHLIYYN